MTLHWYALHSKPNKEELLWREVTARGYEFYPILRVQPVNPRARKTRAYFPGYLFVRIDLNQIGFSALAWLPYSHGLVMFGTQPPEIPETLIQAIRQRLEAINSAGGELFADLKPGVSVTIETGPFAGYEALFDARLPGNERVRVLLKLLAGKQLPVELPANQIRVKNDHERDGR